MTDFKDKWYAHIGDLDRLKLNLPEEQHDEVDELQSDLKELVDDAVSHKD